MAIWPHFSSTNFHLKLMIAFILYDFPVGTLAETNSSSILYTFIHSLGPVQGLPFKNLPPSFPSLLNSISALARQRLLRLINGQIEVWDMVQLITACGLVEAYRIWKRKRRAASHKNPPSNEPTLDGHNLRDNTTALPRVDSDSLKTG